MTAGRLVIPDDVAYRVLCEWTAESGIPHYAAHGGHACPIGRLTAALLGMPDPEGLVAEWRLDLPFKGGRPPLSLNDRGTWLKFAHIIESVKRDVRAAVLAAQIPALRHVHVELHYRPRDRRIRDADNIVATLKPCIDALHQRDPAWDSPLWTGYRPIVEGDDRRYVSWSPPVLHDSVKGEPAATWLMIRSAG